MASASASATTALQVTRQFAAPRERVFRAWTDAEQMKHWCAPSDDYETTAEVDLRVGGQYRIRMEHKNGNVNVAYGEYREVSPPEKLVYTWSWENGMATGTLVTVEFRDLGGSTEVILTHIRFADSDARDKHAAGWGGCLGRLEKMLAA